MSSTSAGGVVARRRAQQRVDAAAPQARARTVPSVEAAHQRARAARRRRSTGAARWRADRTPSGWRRAGRGRRPAPGPSRSGEIGRGHRQREALGAAAGDDGGANEGETHGPAPRASRTPATSPRRGGRRAVRNPNSRPRRRRRCDVPQVVGATGFEPAASWSQTRRATRLRYAPRATLRSYRNVRPTLAPFSPSARARCEMRFFSSGGELGHGAAGGVAVDEEQRIVAEAAAAARRVGRCAPRTRPRRPGACRRCRRRRARSESAPCAARRARRRAPRAAWRCWRRRRDGSPA